MIIKIKKLHIFLLAICVLAASAVIGVCRSHAAARTDAPAKTPLPIVMYHQIAKSPSRAGAYCVTLGELENDLKYIKECGYTTITVSELIDHVENGAPLPEKPIMVTIDDGFETVYKYLLPLLQELDMKAVASVVGAFTDLYTESGDHSLSYSHMNWEEVSELANGNTIEIQNHSYNLHKVNDHGRNGAKKVNGESEQEYAEFLSADVGKMQEELQEHTGKKAIAFAYPFGSYSEESPEVLKNMGFKAALICEEKLNFIDTEDTAWLFRLRRYNRPHGQASAAFFAKMGVGV